MILLHILATGTKLPFQPDFATLEERKLFTKMVINVPNAKPIKSFFRNLASEWLLKVDGVTVFPKLPNNIIWQFIRNGARISRSGTLRTIGLEVQLKNRQKHDCKLCVDAGKPL